MIIDRDVAPLVILITVDCMASTLKFELGIDATALRIIADARLNDFEALAAAGRYHAAIYISGYAVEEYLKCAICKTLDSTQLPKIFEYHDLESLLFYSGHYRAISRDLDVKTSMAEITATWRPELRYEDPNTSKFNSKSTDAMRIWLSDAKKGVIPWLRARL